MKKHSLELINSTFSIEDGEKIILDLLNSKIKFLNDQIFSLKVRFGKDQTHSEVRVNELIEEVKKVKSFLSEIKKLDNQLVINCNLNMEVIKNNEVTHSKKLFNN